MLLLLLLLGRLGLGLGLGLGHGFADDVPPIIPVIGRDAQHDRAELRRAQRVHIRLHDEVEPPHHREQLHHGAHGRPQPLPLLLQAVRSHLLLLRLLMRLSIRPF